MFFELTYCISLMAVGIPPNEDSERYKFDVLSHLSVRESGIILGVFGIIILFLFKKR